MIRNKVLIILISGILVLSCSSTGDNTGITSSNSVGINNSALGVITLFTATKGDKQISLAWLNPDDTNFAGVRILRKTGGYPININDGVLIFNSFGSSKVDYALTNGTQYFYKAFAFDTASNFSSSASVTATPLAVAYNLPLLGYWDFDETSGATANDSSGNNFHGKINTAIRTIGKINNGLEFIPASNSEVDLSPNFQKTPMDYIADNSLPFTLMVWVNLTSYATNGYIYSGGWSMSLRVNNGIVEFYAQKPYNSIKLVSSTTTLGLSTWYHVAVTFANDSAKIYINGVEEASNSLLGKMGSTCCDAIGAYSNGAPSSIFSGKIDEVMLYATIRTPSEILNYYNSTK